MPRYRPAGLFEAIALSFNAGLSDVEIGLQLGYKPESIRTYRKALRLLRPNRKPHIRITGKTAAIAALRAQGWSIWEIVDELHISKSAVTVAMSRIAASAATPNYDYSTWSRDFRLGKSASKIARENGVTCPTVLHALRRLGFDTKTRLTAYPAACCCVLNRKENRRQGLCPSCFRKKYPGGDRAAVNRRRARRLAAPGNHTDAQWQARVAEYGSCCAYCGRTCSDPQRDHVVPLIRGGSNDVSNLVPACASCNSRKRDRPWIPWPADRLTEAAIQGPLRNAVAARAVGVSCEEL